MESNASERYRPLTLVAELTYRCPLRCLYCSNPIERSGATQPELAQADWETVLTDAEALGVVQVHFTGGEPVLRPDLQALIAHARGLGLYTSLITSGLGLTRERLEALAAAGLDHVQVSIQGMSDADALQIAGRPGLAQKLQVMEWVRALDLPLTINVVLHRHNIEQIPQLIDLAERLGAERLELANSQYLGWALANREYLLPDDAQIERARAQANAAKERLKGRMELLFVLPDYHAGVVRPCMQGWASRYIVVSPDGMVLPCHQAHTLPGLAFERVSDRPLAEIWRNNPALEQYRGESWMEDPCRSCERRTQDFGGCRCQAFALTGRMNATDPACKLAPEHDLILRARDKARAGPDARVQLRYRKVPREA
ncbi:MAG TPA: pyrroloquinoline quinone biosynthesis protein PqqE [Polyangiales bacterium]|nr:pyrroloquinoline quinone biosynthesis protein PqqE [Polyangiales bacterium]